jgi:hypothetical protein
MRDESIVWEDPPDDGRNGRGNHISPRRCAMDDHPGRWLLWGTARSIGGASHLRSLGYEVATRTGDGIAKIYARRPPLTEEATSWVQ